MSLYRAIISHFNSNEQTKPLRRREKCRRHTKAITSRFNSRQDEKTGRAVEAHFTSGIDEGTGTGSVRNAFSTLEWQRRISMLRSMRRHLGEYKKC